MKKIIALFLIIPSSVFAHGMAPLEITETVIDPVSKVTIDVLNYHDKDTCYSFTQNGYTLPNMICLKSEESESIDVWVRSEPDVVSINEICSISGSITDKVRTRVCTIVKTNYPYSQLQQL